MLINQQRVTLLRAAQVSRYKGLPAGEEYVPHSHLAAMQAGGVETLFNATTLRPIQQGLDVELEQQLGYSYAGVAHLQ